MSLKYFFSRRKKISSRNHYCFDAHRWDVTRLPDPRVHVRIGRRRRTRWRSTWLRPCWQLTWWATRVAKRIATWQAGNSPRGDTSKGHLSVCFRHMSSSHFFPVSFLDSTTCLSHGDPRVVSFFVHVSCAYWSTCHFRATAHVVLWLFDVLFF